MKNILALSGLAGLLVSGGVAMAQSENQWRYMGTTGHGGDRTVYWIQVAPTTAERWEYQYSEKPDKKGTKITKMLNKYSCSGRTSAISAIIEYSSDGETIQSQFNKSYQLDWRPIVPDTVGESFWKAVCLPRKNETLLPTSMLNDASEWILTQKTN